MGCQADKALECEGSGWVGCECSGLTSSAKGVCVRALMNEDWCLQVGKHAG